MDFLAKWIAPIYPLGLPTRLLICGTLGALVSITIAETMRLAFYKPTQTTSTPGLSVQPPAPTDSLEAAKPSQPTSHVEHESAGISVTSTNQSGGVTAANIQSVTQNAEPEKQ